MSPVQYAGWSVFALVVVYVLATSCGLVTTRRVKPRHRRDWRSEAGSLAVGVGWGVVLSVPLWLLLVAGAWWLGVLS